MKGLVQMAYSEEEGLGLEQACAHECDSCAHARTNKEADVRVENESAAPVESRTSVAYWSGVRIVKIMFPNVGDADAQHRALSRAQALMRDTRKYAWVLVCSSASDPFSELHIRVNASVKALAAARGLMLDMCLRPELHFIAESGDRLGGVDRLTDEQLRSRFSAVGLRKWKDDLSQCRVSVAPPESADTPIVFTSPGGNA